MICQTRGLNNIYILFGFLQSNYIYMLTSLKMQVVPRNRPHFASNRSLLTDLGWVLANKIRKGGDWRVVLVVTKKLLKIKMEKRGRKPV